MASQSDHPQNNHHPQQPPPTQQEEQPNKESGQASGSNRPPATGYPPAMGYPAGPVGYPNTGCYGYPNNSDNNPYHHYYPYAQAPPAAYYNSQSQRHQHQQQGGFRASYLVRAILIGLILLSLVMFTASILMWLILRPEIPVFQVETFSVSNFNASSPGSFTGSWETNVTVQNPNTKLRVYFDQVENFVYYDDDNLLASTFVQPFVLDTRASGVVRARLSANNSDQQLVGAWAVDQMAKDRSNGTMRFNLRMAAWTTFKLGSWWTRHPMFRVYCEDLKVAFVGDSGNANLVSGNNKLSDCVVLS